MEIRTYDISGLGCSHCVTKVEQAIMALPDIRKAEVSLPLNQAVVTMEVQVPESRIQEAVAGAGHYKARERRGS